MRAPRWAIAAWIGACTFPGAAWVLGATTTAAVDAASDGRDAVALPVRGSVAGTPLVVVVTLLVIAWTVLAVSLARSVARAVHLDGDRLTVHHLVGRRTRPPVDVVALRARDDLLDSVEIDFADGRHVTVPGGTSDRGSRRALEELAERLERLAPGCRIDL